MDKIEENDLNWMPMPKWILNCAMLWCGIDLYMWMNISFEFNFHWMDWRWVDLADKWSVCAHGFVSVIIIAAAAASLF